MVLVKSEEKVNGIFLSKTLKCFAVSEVHFLDHKHTNYFFGLRNNVNPMESNFAEILR